MLAKKASFRSKFIVFNFNSCIFFGLKRTPQHLLHRFSFCDFIHELIEISDFPHQSIFHLFDTISTDNPSDESASRIEEWSFSEECLEINSFIENSLKSLCVISCEPHDDCIHLRFGSSFFLYFCDIEWIYFCDWHREYFGILHISLRIILLLDFHQV